MSLNTYKFIAVDAFKIYKYFTLDASNIFTMTSGDFKRFIFKDSKETTAPAIGELFCQAPWHVTNSHLTKVNFSITNV